MFRLAAAVAIVLLLVQTAFAQKETLSARIDEREGATWELALKIWNLAEPGYQEFQSAKLLACMLRQAGFHVKRGVAEIPTAFTATCGRRFTGHCDPGRIRRVARIVAGRRSRAAASRTCKLRTRLRSSSVWRRIGFGGDRHCGSDQVGPTEGNGSVLWLPCRGRGQRQGIHGPGWSIQRLRRRASLASLGS